MSTDTHDCTTRLAAECERLRIEADREKQRADFAASIENGATLRAAKAEAECERLKEEAKAHEVMERLSDRTIEALRADLARAHEALLAVKPHIDNELQSRGLGGVLLHGTAIQTAGNLMNEAIATINETLKP